ncbi:hypothetical protein GCM10022254_20670 [Actinomadura meridiana]|uniref:Uncharacterized protein n=1 Tax=Actinomadura meridiana TaxID=559626 RepID=A0ABP8BWZ7_9ACTN
MNRRTRYAAAGLIGIAGLVVAATIAVLGLLASGYVPTAPSGYLINI